MPPASGSASSRRELGRRRRAAAAAGASRRAVAKTGRARWVPVPDVLFEAVTRLVAREDRVPERPVFQGFGGDRFRTALTRACTAAGVPAFSPHDLRHRRVSLLHWGGDAVGANRRACRSRRPDDHRSDLYPRCRRRRRTRLRGDVVLTRTKLSRKWARLPDRSQSRAPLRVACLRELAAPASRVR